LKQERNIQVKLNEVI